MTPSDLLIRARVAGLQLTPRGDKLHVEPVPPPELLAQLATLKVEVLAVLETERRIAVAEAIADAFDRLSGSNGPWLAEHFYAVRPLAETLDSEAKRYVNGEVGDVAAFQSALQAWEDALIGDTPYPGRNAPQRGDER